MEHTTGNSFESSVNGITLHYFDSGTGEIPLIFLHGFPFNRSSWNPQVSALPPTYRIIVPDLRGHGESEEGIEPVTIDLMADDVIALLQALEIQRAVFCGLSMGGYIALNLAQRFPDWVSGLILCDTQCVADTEEGRAKRMSTIEAIREKGVDVFAEGMVQKLLAPQTLIQKPELVQEVRLMIQRTSTLSLTNTLQALAARRETCTFLVDIDCPVLILTGADDTITPPQAARLMAEKIHGSEIFILPSAGHLSNLEQPDVFNGHLMKFLQTNFK